jgi:methylmalonyl-CoA/ethylmalonyl-CoA epimerase
MSEPGTTGHDARTSEQRLGALLQIGVAVDDLEAMTTFYRDALRVRFLFAAPGMSFFDLDGVRLMLSALEAEPGKMRASILYFRVTDIAAAHAALLARGVVFEREPHVVHRAPGMELWIGFFRDPEGNALAIASEVRV